MSSCIFREIRLVGEGLMIISLCIISTKLPPPLPGGVSLMGVTPSFFGFELAKEYMRRKRRALGIIQWALSNPNSMTSNSRCPLPPPLGGGTSGIGSDKILFQKSSQQIQGEGNTVFAKKNVGALGKTWSLARIWAQGRACMRTNRILKS